MIPIIRRLWLFMAMSALLNLAALALVGHFWRPFRVATPHAPPALTLLTLLPLPKLFHVVKPPPLRPKLVPPPKPRPQPKLVATPLPPSPRRTPKFAPFAAHAGGAKPASRPKPKPAVPWHTLDSLTARADTVDANKITDMGVARATAPATGDAAGTQPHGDGKAGGAGAGDGKGTGRGGGTGNGTGVGPFGVQGGGGGGVGLRHVVYILDTSGSMEMQVAQWGESRIDRARRELTKQLESLSPNESFSIIAFSDKVRPLGPGLTPASQDALRKAAGFLGGQMASGATDMEAALLTALHTPGVNLIYLITDGVPDVRGKPRFTKADFQALADRIADANMNSVPIYTVGLLGPNGPDKEDGDDSAEAAKLLKEIAMDSGGVFKPVVVGEDGP